MNKYPYTPPPSNAGQISARTKALRPDSGLSDDDRSRARHMLLSQKKGFSEIALALGKGEDQVREALSTIRLPVAKPSRGTLNVSPEDAARFKRFCRNGEPVWEAFHRLVETIDLDNMH